MTNSIPLPSALQRILPDLRAWCVAQKVQLCVIFGSQVSGKIHPGSDVDLAIWAAEYPTPQLRIRWQRELETVANAEVSLVVATIDLNPVLGFEIVRGGALVFEAESGLWAKRRLHLWHSYNDSLPFRRAVRRRLRQFAKEVKHGA